MFYDSKYLLHKHAFIKIEQIIITGQSTLNIKLKCMYLLLRKNINISILKCITYYWKVGNFFHSFIVYFISKNINYYFTNIIFYIRRQYYSQRNITFEYIFIDRKENKIHK